ncbi:hypothetical protein L345_03273, partial [Ophiophagus hannah]
MQRRDSFEILLVNSDQAISDLLNRPYQSMEHHDQKPTSFVSNDFTGNLNFGLIFSPDCKIEVPERLSSCYGRLQHYNLIERCISYGLRGNCEEH